MPVAHVHLVPAATQSAGRDARSDTRVAHLDPDAVLGKPGPLNREEHSQMQAHTTVGAAMLSGSTFALVQMAEQIAITHHEKWNGSGYPCGLSGDAIPISGRIVAVADVFDALTHARPYKAAWSVEAALKEMAQQAGHHFDPALLRVFLELRGADTVGVDHIANTRRFAA